MKVLIVYASAGAGHLKAAQAINEYFLKHCQGIELECIDVLNKTNPLFRLCYRQGYTLLVSHAIAIWRFFFWITKQRFLRFIVLPIASGLNHFNSYRFISFLIRKNPDYIISTHFLSSEISAFLKTNHLIKSKLITVITDFGVHPFWVNNGTDLYVVASGFTKEQLIYRGVQETSIRVLGIPVASKFLKAHNRQELCLKLGLDINKFKVLLMTGSFGIGPLEDVALELSSEAQVLVVCAANKKLLFRLKKRKLKNVKIFGYVNNPEELMSVADIIVTKPGGMTITELLSIGLPPVFISAIPGQEEANIRALSSYGVGLKLEDPIEIRNFIIDLKNNPHKITAMKENMKKLTNKDTLREICDVVCKGSAGVSC